MKLSDYLGFSLFLGFGLWLVLFPASVIHFYNWFHQDRVKMPPPRAVRLVGALWILLLCVVTLLTFRRPH